MCTPVTWVSCQNADSDLVDPGGKWQDVCFQVWLPTHVRLRVLTMNFQKVLGASLAVQLIDVLGDDCDPAALLVQPGLTISDGKMPWVWLRILHEFPPVVIELPHPGWVLGKGFRSGQILGVREEVGVREGKTR